MPQNQTDISLPLTSPSPKRALLVDDVVYNLEWMAEMLHPLGFDSTFALNIAEARRALEHQSF